MLWRHGAEAYILTHPWLPALICMILLISDFWLRLVQQKYYRKQSTWEYVGGVDEFVFGPTRPISALARHLGGTRRNLRGVRTVVLLVFSLVFIVFGLVFITAVLYFAGVVLKDPYIYGFMVGSVIVSQLVVHVRHMYNIAYFRRLSRPDSGVSGKLSEEGQFTYWLSSQNTLGMMLLAFVLFVLTNSPVLLGGTFGLACDWYGLHKVARELRLRKDQSETDTAAVESEQSTP